MRRSTAPESLFVSQYYWPEPIGSAPYCTDIAEWLVAAGWSVQVLTVRPNYPRGAVFPAYADGALDRETRNGVAVERVAPWLPRGRGALARICSDGAFLLRGLLALLTRRVRRSDVVLALCPSILAVLLGRMGRRRGGQLIAVVHDIQSGLAGGLGMVRYSWLLRLMRYTERLALNSADLVVVLSDHMRRQLVDQGVTSRIDVMPIWVDLAAIRPARTARNSVPVALYSGSLGKKQALGQLIALAEELRRGHNAISIVIRGQGSEAVRLARDAAARGLDNIEFRPLLPLEQLSDGLAEGDIHLVPQDGAAADFAVPSKIFAIMAAGRPFVATARPDSLLWQLQEQSRAFLCVPSGDGVAFAAAVLRLAGDEAERARLGARGRAFVTGRHDKTKVLDGFLAQLREAS